MQSADIHNCSFACLTAAGATKGATKAAWMLPRPMGPYPHAVSLAEPAESLNLGATSAGSASPESRPTSRALAMSGSATEPQVQVRFTTKLEARFRVTEAPIQLPTRLTRHGLSVVINHLLNAEKPAIQFSTATP